MQNFRRNALLNSSTAAILRSSPLVHGRYERLPFQMNTPLQKTSHRFLDIYQIGNKKAIEMERARLSDEMNKGYFADMSEMKKHGGKVATANKVLIPAIAAVKFPLFHVNFPDGRALKLPVSLEENEAKPDVDVVIPSASLLCLSFRASSQAMIDSWSGPFEEAFSAQANIHMYKVSVIESWFLSLNPVKKLLIRTLRKTDYDDGRNYAIQRHITYAFGDHYYFRKELKITNLLTGYIFLLDRYGRIRWQGFGTSTQEELSSLLSCTSELLEEK